MANILRNTESIRESYWHSLEIAHRVDDAELLQTISLLENVILSHGQIKSLIYQNILNPATSQTSLVLRAVQKLMEIEGDDIDSSQHFLDSFQACYGENISILVQSISDQSIYLSQVLSTLQNSEETSMTPEDYQSIRNVLQPLKKTMSSASNSLSKFCPTSFAVKACPDLIFNVNDRINEILLQMSTKVCTSTSASTISGSSASSNEMPSSSSSSTASVSPSASSFSPLTPKIGSTAASTLEPSTADPSESCSEYSDEDRFWLIIDLMSDAQLQLSKVLSCMSEYTDLLKAFQSFLDSVDRTVSTVDTSGATRSMNTLLSDASWLETLVVSYQNGSLTKLQLSNGFLLESNSRLLLHVDNALAGIETSVLTDMTSIINAIETRTISVYSQLVMFLYKLQTFMSYNDIAVDGFARELVLWRSPIPILEDKSVCLAYYCYPYKHKIMF